MGAVDFRWARVVEWDEFHDRVRFHVLIGGLRKGKQAPWPERWKSIGRDVCLQKFDPDERGIYYMLSMPDSEIDFEI